MSDRQISGPKAHEIGAMLHDHAEAVVRMVFPHAVEAGGFLCIGSLDGEPGDSLKVRLRGPKRGTWADYAASASDPRGKGDLLKLLQLTVGGGDFRAGIAEAKRFLNLDSMDPQALERMQRRAAAARAKAQREKAGEDERKRRNAEGLWQAASPLTPSSPAFRYLEGRGIDFKRLGKLPGAIRFHHRVSHAELSEQRGERAYLPAMVTKFTLLDGTHAATHVTYLHFDAAAGWVKLPPLTVEEADPATGELTAKRIDAAKKIFSPLYWGAHIPLWKGDGRGKLADAPEGAAIEVAEGIENALSYALANPAARVLAAGTLGNLGALALPPQLGTLTVLADNDIKPAPIEALRDALAKQQAQAAAQAAGTGRAPRTIATRRPPPEFKDWNDWLRGIERQLVSDGEGEDA
jgi:hypothetical protein